MAISTYNVALFAVKVVESFRATNIANAFCAPKKHGKAELFNRNYVNTYLFGLSTILSAVVKSTTRFACRDFEVRIACLCTGCAASATNRIEVARVVGPGTRRAGERRDREAFVYINQLVCTAIITVIGAAITGERAITQSV